MKRYFILIKIAKHRPKRWIEVDLSDFQTFLGELSVDYEIKDQYISEDMRAFYAEKELIAKIIYEEKKYYETTNN